MADKDLQKYWRDRDKPRGPLDRELPDWAQSRVNYIRLGFIILFAALAFSSFLSGCSATASGNWRPAANVLPESAIQSVIAENTASSLSEAERADLAGDMQVLELAENLVAIDFNDPLLTGQLGTRFAVYRLAPEAEPQQVFQTYLDSELPKDFELVSTIEQTLNGLPCLHIHQVSDRTREEVTRYELCYDGNTYVLQNEINLSFDDESDE